MKHISNLNMSLRAQRNLEIATYGRQLSLRPSVCHKSKKVYNRKNNKTINIEE